MENRPGGGSSWGNLALFVLPILLVAGLFYADLKWFKKEDYQKT